MNERQRLRDLLLAKSYRQGTFTLTSGKTSDFYVDGKQTTLDAEGAYLCGRLLFELIRTHPEPIVGVGGMTLGADPLVTAVSMVSYLEKAPIPAFIVRKEAKGHGTGNFIEGRKAYTLGVKATYLNALEAELQYTEFYGAGQNNAGRDRDNVGFNVKYSF